MEADRLILTLCLIHFGLVINHVVVILQLVIPAQSTTRWATVERGTALERSHSIAVIILQAQLPFLGIMVSKR